MQAVDIERLVLPVLTVMRARACDAPAAAVWQSRRRHSHGLLPKACPADAGGRHRKACPAHVGCRACTCLRPAPSGSPRRCIAGLALVLREKEMRWWQVVPEAAY
eukprot:11185022-Lingulodinium_polyedra.AAC.1